MSEHDPQCPWKAFYYPGGVTVVNCLCDLIGKVRADTLASERERIIRTIEVLPYDHRDDSHRVGGVVTATRAWAYLKCVEIVRGAE